MSMCYANWKLFSIKNVIQRKNTLRRSEYFHFLTTSSILLGYTNFTRNKQNDTEEAQTSFYKCWLVPVKRIKSIARQS